MKYEEANYVQDGSAVKIDVGKYDKNQLEEMQQKGEFYCPGNKCNAKLCLVHHSKNGGRSYFLKAINDDEHSSECNYKIDNYKTISIREPENGFFTEEQVDNHVKAVDKDVREPLRKKNKEVKKSNDKKGNRNGTKNKEGGKVHIRKTANTGRIIYGEDGIEGTKGRMSRTYAISRQDIGKIKTIYGTVEWIYKDEYGQLHVNYNEERLGNIEVLAGPIIETNYPTIYSNLYLAEEYFKENCDNDVMVVAGGLINEKNGKMIMELLTAGGLRIDGNTVYKLAIKNIKEAM